MERIASLHEIVAAFRDCPEAAAALNRNIRELAVVEAKIERLRFEWGYMPDGWFYRLIVAADPDYQYITQRLKRLRLLKKMFQRPEGWDREIDMEKARHVRFEDVYDWQKFKAKRDGFIALCPLHNDQAVGSFNVFTRDGRQWFKCFSCQNSGDIISFMKILHKTGFFEAVKLLND